MPGLVLQCGGPTAVVNVTLAAVIRRWRTLFGDRPLHGGRYGVAALLMDDWIDVSAWGRERLARIEGTSGMALGGGRDRLDERDLENAAARLVARGIDTLFLIGGNGTMAAGRAIARVVERQRHALRVIGIPKTIDNDIPHTDVAPGFPSAARFLIEAVRDVAGDASSMRGYEDVVLIEAMGRHAGWLAASTLLARADAADAPHLVLVPEIPIQDEAFVEAVRVQHARAGLCVVTVAEGVRDATGTFLAERAADRDVERDAAGQMILGRSGGPLPYLASLVRERLRLRCRLVRPDVLQRCSRAHVSTLDRTVAAMVGTAAAECAADAINEPVMIALRRSAEAWRTERVPLADVRGERTLPLNALAEPSALSGFV